MAGGKGTRFWPLSRSQRPKQLLKLLSRTSLIGETANRAVPISGRRRTLVVTVAEQLDAMREELPTIARENFLAEPEGKNTAPCIGLGAIQVASRDLAARLGTHTGGPRRADLVEFRVHLKRRGEM